MDEERRSWPYVAGLLGLFGLVALARHDLVGRAIGLALLKASKSPAMAFKIAGETVLFVSCLVLALRVIPTRVQPRRDAAVFLSTLALGWLAEAWGTRLGLWSYYTRETPPLWIAPAWSLAALLIDRVSFRAEARWGGRLAPSAAVAGYWLISAAFLAVFLLFCRPVLASPWTWVVLAAYAATLTLKPRPSRDVWVLASGLVYVFFADFWGTTNGCWRYYVQAGGGGMPALFAGVSFGMLFDSVLLLMGLRLGRLIVPEQGR